MDFETIANAISTVGFPIAACSAMFWYINKSENRHKEEIDKLSQAINNNTLIMQQLANKIGG